MAGKTVVDLGGGYQDRDCSRPWLADTLVNVYTTTKGRRLRTVVEDGALDYDGPVKDYWPEFRAGPNGLTVGQFLSHQSGICGLPEPVTVTDLYDWPRMTERIAAMAQRWNGTKSRKPPRNSKGPPPGGTCERAVPRNARPAAGRRHHDSTKRRPTVRYARAARSTKTSTLVCVTAV